MSGDLSILDWGVGALALPGEVASGDLHLVKPVPRGVLVAVVDGLGHGAEAAIAARTAVATLDQHAEEAVPALIERCHAALKGSRGVVMSVVSIDARENALTWAGVGNVEAVLLHWDAATRTRRDRIGLVTRGGIVGSELPPVRAQRLPITPDDLLILATDGIRDGFVDALSVDASSQRLAKEILAQHGKGTDDALVLVARYRPPPAGAAPVG